MSDVGIRSTVLRDGDRVAIVGGGPAGSLFAFHLLRKARLTGRNLDVVIVEKRHESLIGGDGGLRGCNSCAGGVSPRLNQVLAEHDIVLPEAIIQGHIDYVWVHGQWKNFRLKVPRDTTMYSVFRGSLPARRDEAVDGLDDYLLRRARDEGARLLRGRVLSIDRGPTQDRLTLTVDTAPGRTTSVDARFVAIASGINARSGPANGADGLAASVRRLNPAFVPGKERGALLFELDVGEDYLARTMNREVHFIEYGSKHLDLEHTALLPKGRFLTVAMIGRCVDEATFPGDSRRIIDEFLALPQIERILPGIGSAQVACVCFPRMSVKPAASPFGDNFALIGDAVGARLNKDGLYSAHITSARLVEAVLHDGTDRESLEIGFGKAIDRLAADNRYGQVVFTASRLAFARPLPSRVAYQAFATEFKVRGAHDRPVGSLLWKIASGASDYRQIFREMISFRLLRSLLVGAAVTVRNVAVERLLGLRWGEYGRYPTVVLKEKRDAVKRDLEARLGSPLGASPDVERLYVIKILGSADDIMRLLARFGDTDSPFLKLRHVNVRRIEGEANRVGSVIRYGTPIPGLGAELRLTSTPRGETLFYQLDERLTDNGVLLIDVSPTREGNHKLSVYAAFDFKRGRHPVARIMWRSISRLFPEFVHDVVWNHALCTIKEHVEQRKF